MTDESSNKKEIEQLRNSEKKFQNCIDRRNELNDLARVLREERDMLNSKHKESKESMKKSKSERDELVSKMRHHKELRNKLQEQAKKFIEAKQAKKGEDLPLRVEELKADFQMLEYRQETVPMSSSEENELIDLMREKRKEYDNTKKQLEKQKLLEIDISDKDNVITELFKKADEEHEKVQKFYNENQKKHEEYVKLVRELSISIGEANKKHEQYIETREEAQRNHEKATDMKSKIIAVKGERRKRWEDAKKAIQEQNIRARNAVMDKKKLEEHADNYVDALKKGKKITL